MNRKDDRLRSATKSIHTKQSSLGSVSKTMKKSNPSLGDRTTKKKKSYTLGCESETVKKTISSFRRETKTMKKTYSYLRCGTETTKKKHWSSEWGTKIMEYFLQSGTMGYLLQSGTPRIQNQDWCFLSGGNSTTDTPPSTEIPYLDDDLFCYSILSKLPAISVLRFRCINKLWNARLRHPNFIASHSSHGFTRPPSLFCTIFEKYKKHPLQRNISFCFMENTDPNQWFQMVSEIYDGAVGHYNGLICLKSKFGFGIVNPCTREVLFHPFPHQIKEWLLQQDQDQDSPSVECPGFGFDPMKNEYKYVHIFADENTSKCFIYTLGINSWREFALPNNLVDCFRETFSDGGLLVIGFYANGSLHWFSPPHNKLISFNLHYEEFHVIAGPQHPDNQIYHSLVRQRESLCLVFKNQNYEDKDKVEINLYMLKGRDNDKKQFSSWSNERFIAPRKSSSVFSVVDVLGYLFWIEKGHVYWYNPPKDELYLSPFSIRKGRSLDSYGVNHHVDNLLSLKTLIPPGAAEVKYVVVKS